MAEAGFTKGPWEVQDNGLVMAGPDKIVFAFNTGLGIVPRGEDTALICAAPDLYKALKGLLEHVTPAVRNNSDFSVSWRAAERFARTALRKAQSGEPQ